MADEQLDQILTAAAKDGASDIHFKVGVPAYVRLSGSLKPFNSTPLSPEDIERMLGSLLGGSTARVHEKSEVDIAHTIPGVARFRCNIFKQRGSIEAVLRVVPYTIPTIEELGLPPVLKHIALESRGLVLVTGITGSGKSTSIASMVQHVNESLPVHIITIEDPIEFVYRDKLASISQREVGIDTENFHSALKYVLRQDPDVIVLGEMRDRETAQTAMTAAETGHLVFSTLHTADTIQTVDRIIDLFPADQHGQMRHQLASTLKAVISMRLISKKDGSGMVPAIEVMINTPAIRSLIDENKMGEIKGLMTEGQSQYGMQTFDQALLKLYQEKKITRESAIEEATSPAELELAMRGITAGTVSAKDFMGMGGSQGSTEKRKKAEELFKRARRLYEQDLIEDSLREVRRALVDYADYADAQELVEKIEKKMARDDVRMKSEPYVAQGLDLVAKNRFGEAVAVFNQGLAIDPNNEKLTSLKRAAEEKMQRVSGISPLLQSAAEMVKGGKYAEARQALQEVQGKDPGNAEALDLTTEAIQAQTRQQAAAEVETLAAKAEELFGKKMFFDSVALWNQVREIQPDHQKAVQRLTESGAELKKVGVPGLPTTEQAAWAAGVLQAYERGVQQFLAGQALACLNEWKQGVAKAPQAGEMMSAYSRKIEELHAAHIRYHLDRARQLSESGELGRAMAQLRHAVQVDPQSADARGQHEALKATADQAVQKYLAEAEEWVKRDRMRAAVYCWERAYEIDPSNETVKAKVTDGRARLVKMRDIFAAMDRKTG